MLLIDAGNTRVKWALAAPGAAVGEWIASGAVAHADIASLAEAWRALPRPDGALLSNVAGAPMLEQLKAQLALAAPGIALESFGSVAARAGLRNGYRNPAQLGSDRFAAAIGARFLYPGQKLFVATCGTATTVDAIDAAGVFLGGMILPGLGLMAASLARNTAQLPQVKEGAILAGCVNAQAGAIERACDQLDADLCLLSGGAARYVAPALAVPHRLIDNIVLLGLHAASLSKE